MESSDKFLAFGIYGYEFANAPDLMRDYSGWSAGNFTRFQNKIADLFYPTLRTMISWRIIMGQFGTIIQPIGAFIV